MHEQEGTIQLFAAAKCPFSDIILQQIAESYLLGHASLRKLTRHRLSVAYDAPKRQGIMSLLYRKTMRVFQMQPIATR